MNSLNRQDRLGSQPHRDAVARSRADRDRTLAAMHALEHMLGAAAPGRERAWKQEVLAALHALESAMQDQDASGEQAESLLSEILQIDPRFEFRVTQLRRQLSDLRRTAASLRSQLEQPSDATPDYADIRQRLDGLLTALRHYRAQETDLIFEAYNVDIGPVD